MNPTLNGVSVEQGQTLLSNLSDCYFTILNRASLEQIDVSRVVCKFEVPGIGERSISASSSNEAIRLALIELASSLTSASYLNSNYLLTSIVSSTEETQATLHTTTERFLSKTRQVTVGVTMPSSLKNHLVSLAHSQNTSFADVSRRYALFGFEDFEDRSLFVSSKTLFEGLRNELRHWHSADCEQVMLRLEPGQAVRIRTTAKEYKKSASELGALFMAHGLVLQEQLVSLEAKVSSFKGAAIRPLVTHLGLDSYAAPLISGILVGSIRAPKAILKRFESFFEASETLLTRLFKRSFDNRMIPAFKAENGKPEVLQSAIPWKVAVTSLDLPADQTKTLLDLEHERI